MRYEDEGRRRGRGPGGRGPAGWEPADTGEARRWHGDDEHRMHRHGHRHFPGPFEGPDFPAGQDMRSYRRMLREAGGMRGPRARRGDVRAAALALLAEQAMNGYQIIQAIRERSGGVWQPSPGSVYPALQQLEDEGLVSAEASDGGRRAYQLTDEGRAYAQAHPDELRAPWDVVAGSAGGAAVEMRQLISQVAMAAIQVVSAGSEAQARQARQQLVETRKALYRILAADDEDTPGDGE
jgi:DNA-binding PadR family transcriptional regulator